MTQTTEILNITQEECAEVIQAISKIHRFGFDIHNAKENLEHEIGDVLCMIDLLVENCIVSDSNINEARKAKREKLKLWSKIKNL